MTDSNRTGSPYASSSSSPYNSNTQYERHPDYYIPDGNVIFLVEDILFKVHRSRLESYSPVFREMWAFPPPEGSTEGSSDDNPIVLQGIKAIDFTRFLWIVYPLALGTYQATTVEDWTSILDQASRWQIPSLQSLSADQLHTLPIPPIPKISLWHKYNLDPNKLASSYAELATRSQSLTEEEAESLGLSVVVKVAKARDEVHRKGICGCYQRHPPEDRKAAVVARIIKDIFGIPSDET